MLVCSVVLRPQRNTIAASIAEAALAVDGAAISAIFAILADDPGAANDRLDGFVGKLMAEAATAAAVVDAGSRRNAVIVEETIALASLNAAGGGIAVAMIEATTSDTAQDAIIIPAVRDAMLDGIYVNSDGTVRQANAGGIMVNL